MIQFKIMNQKFATIIKIPSFVRSFVKPGILASYDNETGEIHLEKSEETRYDKDKSSNIFQKVLQNSLLPKIDGKAVMVKDREDYSISQNDGIKLIEISKKEYEEEFLEQKQIQFLTFKSKNEENEKEEEETFHVIHPDEQDNSNTKDYSLENVNSRLTVFMENTNPISTIQFLSLLLPGLLCQSITVITENIDQHLEGLLNDDWNLDKDRSASNNNLYRGHFRFFPKIDIPKTAEELKVYESAGDKIIIYNSEYEKDTNNGWYVIKGEKKDVGDNVDGNICNVVLELGFNLISTVVILAFKHIEKYLKKYHKKNNHHIFEENNLKMYDCDEQNIMLLTAPAMKPCHKKIKKNSRCGNKLWSKIIERTKKRKRSIIIEEEIQNKIEEEELIIKKSRTDRNSHAQ